MGPKHQKNSNKKWKAIHNLNNSIYRKYPEMTKLKQSIGCLGDSKACGNGCTSIGITKNP